MTVVAMKEIGEIAISDSREGGKDYLLRPSFSAMMRVGEPDEIVKMYAQIHGSEVQQLIASCTAGFDSIPEWMAPSFNVAADNLLFTSMLVLQACCDDDLDELIGEWADEGGRISYQPGLMAKDLIIIFARELMQHGIVGKASVRRLQRHESGETTNEFKAFDYISAARSHFGMNRDEASALTMTEFQLMLAQKYPDQKGFTREEYDAVADDYLAKQAARRAKQK
ncbi:hypothetical protein H9W87_09860 [Enterobacter roggenkampii]|nr:DUF6246 family protein [Escherichia coli]QNQ31383.1 hypothetical protein H9W87_09860 [Enterobacter roggenkampii]DAU05346.1 MAG TPA: hypothetical protein [Caudoviricetes sp.]